LEIDSRLEIGFERKPKDCEAPSFSAYNYKSEYGKVIFEVETRVTARYIPPGAEYKELETERKDILNYYLNYSGVRKDTGPCMISYTAQSAAENPYRVPRICNE
jgi:hypothetical protein